VKLKSSLLSLALMASFATVALAQQAKGSNEGAPGKPTASSTAVESLATASSLVRHGDANKDAMSLITADRIMAQVGASDSKAEVVTTSSGEKKTDKGSIASILERAKQSAGSRADLVALANDAAASGARGSTSGPGRKTTVVNCGSKDVYRVTFRGGEPIHHGT
jgi:hypothetical protein